MLNAALLAGGSAIGLALGTAFSRRLARVVYRAAGPDPLLLAAAAAAMVLIGLLAAGCRHAARCDRSGSGPQDLRGAA